MARREVLAWRLFLAASAVFVGCSAQGAATPGPDASGPLDESGTYDAAAPRDTGATPGDTGAKADASDAHDAADSGDDAGVLHDAGNGATFMAPPSGWSYGQLVYETQFGYDGMGASPSAANQGTFVSNGVPTPDTSVGFLNDWNFGNQSTPEEVWSPTGSAPYWGSSESAQTGTYASGDCADYAFPGNVFQTSTGANGALFGAYGPQTFTSSGTGLTLQDVYLGGPQQLTILGGGPYYYEWSSGMINTQGKRYFPFGGATEFYAQVKAQMAGPNDGSWSAIWTLLDEGGTGQEIDIQEFNVSGPDPDKMYSHVQNPGVLVGTGTSTEPLYAGLHVYGWHVDSTTQTLTTYLDGVQTGTFTGPQVGAKYYLILNASISSGQQSWQSSEGFAPNSTANMAMSVAEIQVYQP